VSHANNGPVAEIAASLPLGRKGRGTVFTPRDFLDLGSRSAVDKTLSRLASQHKVRRLARGIYDYPKHHNLLGDLWPPLTDVVKAVACDSNRQLQVTGIQALHALGLTTQVPAKVIYLTDGKSRDIQIGKKTIQLKHASPSVMAGCGQKAGLVLQAIRYLGSKGLNKDIIQKLFLLISDRDKKQLKPLIRFAPPWSRDTLYQLTA
jgi:hypothetical protein